MAGAGVEDVLLDVTGEHGGDGAGLGHVGLVHAGEGFAADAAVSRVKEATVLGGAEADFLAFLVADEGEVEVGVGEAAVDVFGCGADFAGHGEEFFFARRERVGALALEVVKGVAVDGELAVFGEPSGDGAGGDGEDFRIDPACGFGGFGGEGGDAVPAALGVGDAHVLVVGQAGVEDDAVEEAEGFVAEGEDGEERG